MSRYDLKFIPSTAKKYNITKKVGTMKTKESTPAKTYSKTRSEHAKDVLIVALIVAIASFIGGMQFQASQQAEVQRAIKLAQTAQTVAPAKK